MFPNWISSLIVFVSSHWLNHRKMKNCRNSSFQSDEKFINIFGRSKSDKIVFTIMWSHSIAKFSSLANYEWKPDVLNLTLAFSREPPNRFIVYHHPLLCTQTQFSCAWPVRVKHIFYPLINFFLSSHTFMLHSTASLSCVELQKAAAFPQLR